MHRRPLRSRTAQRLSAVCLTGVLLLGLTLPRFGLVWHNHEDPDAEHDHDHLHRLLALSQASHPLYHTHPHAAPSAIALTAADTLNLHSHYVADSLLILFCFQQPLTQTLLRAAWRTSRRRILWVRRLAPLPARAPPGSYPLISAYFTASARALSTAV